MPGPYEDDELTDEEYAMLREDDEYYLERAK